MDKKTKSLLKDIYDEDACYVLNEVEDYTVENVKKALEHIKSEEDDDSERFLAIDKLTDEHFEALAFACSNKLFKRGPSTLPKEYSGEETNISEYNTIVTFYVVEGSSGSMLYKDEVLFTHYHFLY